VGHYSWCANFLEVSIDVFQRFLRRHLRVHIRSDIRDRSNGVRNLGHSRGSDDGWSSDDDGDDDDDHNNARDDDDGASHSSDGDGNNRGIRSMGSNNIHHHRLVS